MSETPASTASPPTSSPLTRDGRVIPPDLDEVLVARVVTAFYARARLDPLLGPIFAKAIADDAWPPHLAAITDFWSALLLGTGRYHGRPLAPHLRLEGLGTPHFTRWLALFRATAEAECSPETAALFVDRAERIGTSFRLNIGFHRGEDVTTLGPMRAPPTLQEG